MHIWIKERESPYSCFIFSSQTVLANISLQYSTKDRPAAAEKKDFLLIILVSCSRPTIFFFSRFVFLSQNKWWVLSFARLFHFDRFFFQLGLFIQPSLQTLQMVQLKAKKKVQFYCFSFFFCLRKRKNSDPPVTMSLLEAFSSNLWATTIQHPSVFECILSQRMNR